MSPAKRPPTLADYVRSVMDKDGLSLRDVEERSRRGGLEGISRPHINKIKNGFMTNPSPDKLRALARGLGRPEEEVLNTVLGKDTVPEEFTRKLVYEAAGAENWSDDQKKRFLQAVATIAAGIRSERHAT